MVGGWYGLVEPQNMVRSLLTGIGEDLISLRPIIGAERRRGNGVRYSV